MDTMLVIVVDASKGLAPYWEEIKVILEHIVRKFCEKHASTSSDHFGGRYNLNLVVTTDEDGYATQSSPQFYWPQSMDSFLDSLFRLNFNEYDYLGKCGVIEGISKALMMFPSTRNRTQAELMGKRHCVLVTASHPYPVPREVLVPTNQILESGRVVEVTIDTVFADARRMAQSLAESFISLSVICPRVKPTIKEIYDAGNQNLGSSTNNLIHPQLLLLISEQFPEAREALKQFEERNDVDTNMQEAVFDYIVDNISVQDLMLLKNMVPDPLMEQQNDPLMEQQNDGQQNDVMEISTVDEVDGFIIDPWLEESTNETMWFPEEIVCNDSTLQHGSNSVMQQGSNFFMQEGSNFMQEGSNSVMHEASNLVRQEGNPHDYLQDEQNVVGGSIMIIPEEREGFNTLISNNLWSFEEAPSNFSLEYNTCMNPNYHGQTVMKANLFNNSQMNEYSRRFTEIPIREGTAAMTTNLLINYEMNKCSGRFTEIPISEGTSAMMTNRLINSQMNECFGRFTEIPIPEGTAAIGSAHQLPQTAIANASNNTSHFPTHWLERRDPNVQLLKASNSNALAPANILQHPDQGDQTHNFSMISFQHNANPVHASSLFYGGNGTNTSSSVLVSPTSSACVVGSNGILNSTMQLDFSGATSTRMGARSSKNVPTTKNNTQVTSHNASETMYLSGLNLQTIGIHSSQTTSINTSHTRNVILSNNAPISVVNTSAAKSALPKSSSYSKKPKSAKVVSVPKSKNAKTPNAQSSNQNQPQMDFTSEAPSDGSKVWEGSVTSRGSGATVFVSKLVAYKQPHDSDKMFENWPNMLQLNHLVSLDKISNSPIRATKRYLHFGVLDKCPTWDNMRSKNLCGYIYLHGKTLILWIASNKTRLMGTLYDEVIPVHNHQIFAPTW